MISERSDCVSCGLPCTSRCAYYGSYSTILTCDSCEDEVDDLYEVDGEQLCEECAKEKFALELSCEECGGADDEFYDYDGKILCGCCLLKKLNKVSTEREEE